MNHFIELIVGMLMNGKVPEELSSWEKAVGTSAMRTAAARYLSAARGREETIGQSSEAFSAVSWISSNPCCQSEAFSFTDGALFISPSFPDQQALADYVRRTYNPPIRR